MSDQNQKATAALREEFEKDREFNDKREKIIENLKSISSRIQDENIKTLVDRNIVPNLDNFKDLYTDKIIITSIEDLLTDTLNDAETFIKDRDNVYLTKVIGDLKAVDSLLNTCRISTAGFQHIVKEYLGAAQASVSRELLGFRKNRAERDNAETESIYEQAVERYKKLENKYRK
ncbi:hypothetical protein L5R14_002603, partial [Acinetobacter baumannii]|nr:hypothetical protein [Acinetobacter baumannii]